MKDRLSKYQNVTSMTGLFRRFADVIKSSDVIGNLPTAKRVTAVSESNELFDSYLDNIQARVSSITSSGSSKSDNMLLITNDGRAAATDLRLIADQLDMNPANLDLPGSKINRSVNNILDEYKKSDSIKGTQLVFLDFGMNAGKKNDKPPRYNYNLYNDMISKLVGKGIPREEIARIDEYTTTKQLEELFTRVNDGKIRVLIGSTARMGEGLNVQKRLVALHHINPPYRPSDIEQREGRIIRQGNDNKDVSIYRYVQKRSYDSYMWQMLERKATFISQAMSGEEIGEVDEADEFILSSSEAKAIASGKK